MAFSAAAALGCSLLGSKPSAAAAAAGGAILGGAVATGKEVLEDLFDGDDEEKK